MSKRRNRNRIAGQFAPRLIEMLESPAYRALSLSARRVLDRIEIELAHHGGRDNGGLPVTYDDFQHYGIVDRHLIAPAIRELIALKFIEISKPGYAGSAEFRAPNLFRLTYRPTKREEPTHDWRRITTMEQAKKLVREARPKKQNSSGGKGTMRSGGNHHRNPVVESTTTVIVPKPPLLSRVSGRGLRGGNLSAEPRGTIRTTTVGRGRDAVEVVRDDDRSYGFLRRRGSSYEARWSGDKFDDHLIGEFADAAAAIAVVVEAAVRNGSAAPERA
jgi:hypothetical protein